MSFSIFNFYQQPNTGSYPILPLSPTQIDIIEGDNGTSGTVADFNWYFPYVPQIIPYPIVEGRGIGDVINLQSDGISEIAGEIGLHFGTVTIASSGNFWGDYNPLGTLIQMSGGFQPLVSSSIGQLFLMSGDIFGFPTGTVDIAISVTGNLVQDNPNYANSFVLISGDFWGDYNFGEIFVSKSGNFVADNVNSVGVHTTFSGDFKPLLSDTCFVNYGFSNTYMSATGIFIIETGILFSDYSNLSYGFLSPSFRRGDNE